jgi:23S rRNA (cytidine2498-2'-O)-methyltransferase
VARANSAVLEERLRPAGGLLRANDPVAVGEWLWTMREGAERDLIEELLLGEGLRPRGFLPALVVSHRAPKLEHERFELTFARQGFEVSMLARNADLHRMADEIAIHLTAKLGAVTEYALQVFVPDSNNGNRLAKRAQALQDVLALRIRTALPTSERVLDIEQRREPIPMAQVCMFAPDAAAVGVIASDVALTRAAGGRARMRLSGPFPSRAARKIEEAFSWLGMSPGPGELCVDLGAAPGGWSWVLLERRARVIAVDPARMDEKLQSDKRLRHVQGDAFKFTPSEPADWLFCDMVWRPIEVARMLGRWARQRNTRMLVSNFKLPMKRKIEMLQEIKSTLSESGFTSIRTRQLYHDRDEITLTARVR